MEERDDILLLRDEEGNEIAFEYLDLIQYEDSEYIVLLPVEEETDEEAGGIVIFEMKKSENKENTFLPVEEELLYELFEIFKQHMRDELDFDE